MRPRNEKGFAALAMMLVACAVALILASVMIPSIVEAKRVSTEVAAAEALDQIGSIETTYAHTYGAYVAPQYLTGTLPTTATPTSCSNSFLLNAGQVQPPEGYTMTLAGSPAATFNCPGVANGYSNYSILLTPNNPILAARSFFMAQDGVLHFNDSAPAGPADPVYSITSSNGIVTVGNPANPGTGTGTASNSLVTVWSSTPAQNYVQGSEVLRPAIANGVACGSTNGPQFFGIYVNLTGNNGDPCTDLADWFYAGVGTAPSPVVTAPPPTYLSGGANYNPMGGQPIAGGDNFLSAATSQSSWPALILNNLTVNVSNTPPPSLGGYLRAQVIDTTAGGFGYGPAWCNLTNGSGGGPASCATSYPVTVNPNDVLQLRINWYQCTTCSGFVLQTMSWSLTP